MSSPGYFRVRVFYRYKSEWSVNNCRGSRVAGKKSRVAGKKSRVAGKKSRVAGKKSRVAGKKSRVEKEGYSLFIL